MMTKFLKIAFFSLLLLITATASHAEDTAEPIEKNVKIRVLSERGSIQAGETIWVGIEHSIRPHWHTYWQNAGDSGTPAAITWTLPEGFTTSKIHWPTPQKIPYPPLMNYGYENNVILLQKLTAPEILPEGPLKFAVDVDVLVCEEICIPEASHLDITLNAPDTKDENNEAYLSAARTKLPQKIGWDSTFTDLGKTFKLTTTPQNATILDNLSPEMIEIFPLEWGMIHNVAKPEITLENNQITLTQERGERTITDLKSADFIVAIGKGEKRLAYQVNATQTAAPPTIKTAEPQPETTPESTTSESGISLLSALILALLGGLILNLMPCVFPVLSLKALSLVKIADEHPDQARKHGLAYTAGVILSFTAIAATLIILKTAGAQIGWGFQLQSPIIVGLLAYLLFIIGLKLSGTFEFGSSLTNIGGNLIQGHSPKASFMTGILATIVATPCTAPFMAAAIGFALTQSAIISLLIFATLGLGLALPYLALSFSPKLEKMLPKPGAWMESFKQFLAFPMFLSAAWLTWVLTQQSGSIATLYMLTGATLIIFTLWVSKITSDKFTILLPLLGALALLLILPKPMPDQPVTQQHATHQNWTPQTLEAALATDAPIFVEMTAAWCITCKVNAATSLNIESTKALFAAQNITYLIGDWTNKNAEITKYLNSYGRNGVPLYIFHGQPNENGNRPEPKILPQILTPTIVHNAVTKTQ